MKKNKAGSIIEQAIEAAFEYLVIMPGEMQIGDKVRSIRDDDPGPIRVVTDIRYGPAPSDGKIRKIVIIDGWLPKYVFPEDDAEGWNPYELIERQTSTETQNSKKKPI